VVVNQYLDLLFGKNSKAKQAEKNVVENNSNISLSDNSPNVNWEDNQGYEKRLNYNPSEYRWGINVPKSQILYWRRVKKYIQ
jgi:lipopolysaccharide transport system ATP-binding protein